MAAPLEIILTVVGGGAGLKFLELVSKWLDKRGDSAQADAARADAVASKRDDREHAILDRMVTVVQGQADAAQARSEKYITAMADTATGLHAMASAINDLSARVSALDGRATAPPVRPRSITPTPSPVTGEHPAGVR